MWPGGEVWGETQKQGEGGGRRGNPLQTTANSVTLVTAHTASNLQTGVSEGV